MIRFIGAVAIAICLAACSTPLKLNDVPVEDRSMSAGPGAVGANGVFPTGGQSTVTAVNTAKNAPEATTTAAARTVYFDYDSSVIRPEFQGLIEATAKGVQNNTIQKLTIEGHTDERGGREYNVALGQKRADAVRRALTLLGVPESRLESVSFGKEKPAVVGSTDAAMEKNRRAEISIR
jgi:peptidoglycan-associated lipoprotein